jgi:hypothetical protein
MIDPKSTVRNLLRNWGHNILLQRLVDEKSMAYSSRLQRYTVIAFWTGSIGFTNAMREAPQGLAVSSEVVYYFEYDVNPKSGDRIYEDLPNGEEVFSIDFAAPARGRGGKINFWTAGATRETNTQHA